MTSLIYRNAAVYRSVLRLLYGRALSDRERIVASLVPQGSRVVDVACGDGGIRHKLRGVEYVGVDVSPVFVRRLLRSGIEAHQVDITRDEVPPGDVVLMLGALYQFLPSPDPILERLRHAARTSAIVAEPYKNLAQSDNRLVAAIARRATDPGVSSSTGRFNEESLRVLFERHGATSIVATSRELVAVLPGRGA